MRIPLVTTLCVLFAVAAFAGLDVGQPSPPLTINQVSGPALQLSAYKGKIVALALIDTNCPHCQNLTKLLNTISKEYQSKGVQFVACAMNDHAEQALPQFKQQFEPAFPVGYCTQNAVYAYTQFSIASGRPFYVPHMVFLDRRGIVRGDFPGESEFMTKPDTNIPAKLDELLKGGATTSAAARKAHSTVSKQ